MVFWKSFIFFLTFLQTLSDVRNLNFPTLFTQKYAQEVSMSPANNCSFFLCFPIAVQVKKKTNKQKQSTNPINFAIKTHFSIRDVLYCVSKL